jgi:hypothetical protein
MGSTIFVVLFILAGVAICVNAIVGWIPPEHPQLAGRDPDRPNEPLWSRFLATLDPKFQKDWAAGRRVMRIGTFVVGAAFVALGILMLTR